MLRLERAARQALTADGAALACLKVRPDGISLWATVTLPPPVTTGDDAPLARIPMSRRWPLRLRGDGLALASLVDHVENALAAFDPDVAAEFREELAELDADLGYGFQADLLGNIGPAWAFGAFPAEDGTVGWVFSCGVRDAEELVAHAEALAGLAGEPWTEGAPQDGLRRFSTQAFTVPLELAVAEDRFAVASSEAALREALPMLRTPMRPWPGESQWQAEGVLELEPNLPGDVPTNIRVRRDDEKLHAMAVLDGMTPNTLVEFLAPAAVREAEACAANLRSLALGHAMYVLDHNDEYPASLADIFEYVPAKNLFVCPGDENPELIGEDLRCSYRYVALAAVPDEPGRVVIVYENAGNHEGGRNAAFADHHVEFIPEAAFQDRLAESLELVKKKGWDEYTPEQQAAIEKFYGAGPAKQ